MFKSTRVRHYNDNISFPVAHLGLAQGTARVNGMFEEHHLCIQRGSGFFSLSFYSCDKDFPLLFLTALSSTEASGGAKAEGRKPTVKGERSPFSEMCTEMSRAEGCAGLFLSRAGSICLWGNLRGTAGLSRVTLIYSYSFQFVSEVTEGSERHF